MKNLIEFSNGISLRLDLEGGRFRGIAEVCHDGIPLRSSRLPWTFYAESEAFHLSVRFEDFVLEEVVREGDEVTLRIRSQSRWMPRAQSADAMGEARIKSRRLEEPRALFAWKFRAITERLYENVWHGLAMHLEYKCPGYPIHWLMEAATWEIGGEAEGGILLQQDVSTLQLEQEVRQDDAFSTMEKFFNEGWGGSYPMDMLPRAAGAGICDFQAKGDLALCLFSEKPGLTRARLDKFADENVIHYMDRAYFPLGDDVRTPERKLLVFRAPRRLQRHEWRNLWLDCFTEVRRRIHREYDFELEVPEPCSGGHLWDDHLKARMADWADDLERDLPEYARLGYKQVFIHGVWDSITSDPHPPAAGNICCPYRFRFAEAFGGVARMKRLNDVAAQCGLRLMQWYSFHLSRFAPVWKTHPDWVLKEANGDPWDGAYESLWSGRMRSGYGDHFKREICDVMDQTGISGIFWDSYQNLGVTCLDWSAPDKAPQAEEIFRLQGELQRRGFRQRVEVISIFGVSAVALFGFKDDMFRRRLWDDFVDGDQAFVLMDCSPAFFTGGDNHLSEERLSPARYFWMLGHRSVPNLGADPWGVKGPRLPGAALAEAYARVNHLYNLALPRMDRLRLQKDGTHVVWHDAEGKPSVLWAFRDIEFYPPAGCFLVDAESGKRAEGHGVKAGSVYFFETVVTPLVPAKKPVLAGSVAVAG